MFSLGLQSWPNASLKYACQWQPVVQWIATTAIVEPMMTKEPQYWRNLCRGSCPFLRAIHGLTWFTPILADPTTHPRPRMFNTFRPCATNFKTSIVTDFDIVNHPLARSIVVWWHQVLTERHSSFHIYAHGPLWNGKMHSIIPLNSKMQSPRNVSYMPSACVWTFGGNRMVQGV